MRYLYIIAVVLCIMGCNSEVKEEVPDVSNIDVKYKTVRFELILTNILKSSEKALGLQMIPQTHGHFYNIYFEKVLPVKGFGSREFVTNLDSLWHDQENIKLYNEVTKMYGDFI